MKLIMKHSKLLLVLMMILSWFSVPLLGKGVFKRFLPASLFMSLIVRIVNYIAKKQKWWWWYETLHPRLSGVIPFMLGPFLVGSLWILKWTYSKFFRYMILNLIVDSMFTYVLVYYLQKLGIASLVRMKKIGLMYVFTILALLLYSFQFVKEKISMKEYN
ncbi:hypothetical protein [Niallia sp. NCCP-28]|uniref:hypothetical protein n=1 Tax=Niallia sp. NCCP-28 TaxID=2934712 RepID=UPI00208B058B|nr:hypothetical protein [Niallia sp. NCCP-28]GKU82938.1 hypothetical protein NCCP28_23340 [Niallia sp. NCCP-28]